MQRTVDDQGRRTLDELHTGIPVLPKEQVNKSAHNLPSNWASVPIQPSAPRTWEGKPATPLTAPSSRSRAVFTTVNSVDGD